MRTAYENGPAAYRTIWLSDIHLGFRGCKAKFLLDFLESVKADRIYLLGDIVDLWSMERKTYWPQSHNAVIQKLMAFAKQGVKVTYVPGNHDDLFRSYDGKSVEGIEVKRQAIHTTADGKRLLLVHGDEFDKVVEVSPLLARLGSRAYELLLSVNQIVDFFRRKLSLPYWSLASAAKLAVKRACSYISDFEQAVTAAAKELKVDGVVCGHIHHATISEMNGLIYMNCGDWVESCTALVEHRDGHVELLRWTDVPETIGFLEADTPLAQAA